MHADRKLQCRVMVSIESSSIPGMAPRCHESLALWGRHHSNILVTRQFRLVTMARILAEHLHCTLKRDCNWIIPLGDLEAVLVQAKSVGAA